VKEPPVTQTYCKNNQFLSSNENNLKLERKTWRKKICYMVWNLLNSLVSGLPAGNPVLFDVRCLHRFSFNVSLFIKLLNYILNKAYVKGISDKRVRIPTVKRNYHTRARAHTHTQTKELMLWPNIMILSCHKSHSVNRSHAYCSLAYVQWMFPN
jgi:hypothetical protein